MGTHEIINLIMQKERIESLFTIEAYEDELFLSNDRYLCFGFTLNTIGGADSRMVEKLKVMLENDLPIDSFIQSIMWTSPDVSRFLKGLKASKKHCFGRKDKVGQILQKCVQSEVELFAKSTRTPIENISKNRLRNFVGLMTFKIPIESSRPTESEIDSVKEHVKSIRQKLSSCELHPESIEPETYIRLMSSILNWSEHPSWRDERPLYDETIRINEQIADNGTCIDASNYNYIRLGEKYVTVISPKREPEMLHLNNTYKYFGDPFNGTRGIKENLLVCLNICVIDQEKSKSGMASKHQFANHQAYGPIMKWVPKVGDIKQSFDVLKDATERGDRVFKAALSFVIFADSPDHSKAATSNAISFLTEIGYQMQQDRHYALPIFLTSLPFGSNKEVVKQSMRYKTKATRHLVHMLPIRADSKGNSYGGLGLSTRSGQATGFDNFMSDSNYNITISATSGVGKSFLVNGIILMAMARGAYVWVIDRGRSYLNLCTLLEGSYMDFSPEKDICVNPFSAVENIKEDMDMLIALIEAMAAPREPLSNYQYQEVKRVIQECWDEKGKDLIIDDISKKCLVHGDPRIRDIGSQLGPFSNGGQYERYFNRKHNIDFSNHLTCLELLGLASSEQLQQVILLQLVYLIQKQMAKLPLDIPKFLIVDESWALINDGKVAKYIEEGY
ncbi:MAG: TraC family protein, partial [Gammaproteobacteria bacterium]|nr:TraC family protein [Gammaproteobacteria bacterium]